MTWITHGTHIPIQYTLNLTILGTDMKNGPDGPQLYCWHVRGLQQGHKWIEGPATATKVHMANCVIHTGPPVQTLSTKNTHVTEFSNSKHSCKQLGFSFICKISFYTVYIDSENKL